MTYFNPHPHAEGDIDNKCADGLGDGISIHTLTQRVTNWIIYITCQSDISIHTLTQRVTDIKNVLVDALNISIHTLTQRVTNTKECHMSVKIRFQSTPSRRG